MQNSIQFIQNLSSLHKGVSSFFSLRKCLEFVAFFFIFRVMCTILRLVFFFLLPFFLIIMAMKITFDVPTLRFLFPFTQLLTRPCTAPLSLDFYFEAINRNSDVWFWLTWLSDGERRVLEMQIGVGVGGCIVLTISVQFRPVPALLFIHCNILLFLLFTVRWSAEKTHNIHFKSGLCVCRVVFMVHGFCGEGDEGSFCLHKNNIFENFPPKLRGYM